MAIPKPVQLPSGSWRIRMRLGGENISLTGPDKKALIKEAEFVKAEYKAGRRAQLAEEKENPHTPTIFEAFDNYLAKKSNTLSPATIRFYREVQDHRFKAVMHRPITEISDNEWQSIVDKEAARYAPKTLRNSYTAIKTVIRDATGHSLPDVTYPGSTTKPHSFLMPDEIPKFVAAAKDTPYAVPLLLALSSMRISEISALNWKDIGENPDFIHTTGAVVLDENNQYVSKKQNKNVTSSRNVPILIPELKVALERDRKEEGSLIPCTQNNLRLACHRICKQAGVTDVSIHGLRHSFASLCYHLRVPEKIAQDMGGWSDPGTMHKIYTHIAQSDFERYKTALAGFFEPPKSTDSESKNAHENAHREIE